MGTTAFVGAIAIQPIPGSRIDARELVEVAGTSDLVVVSHRGPVRFESVDGRRVTVRNAGGLVTALRDVTRHVAHVRWICAASSEEDRRAATSSTWLPTTLGDSVCELRMLGVDPEVHHRFYAIVANPILWFVQHYLWDHRCTPEIRRNEHDAWSRGYVTVNRQFADAVADLRETPPGALVMLHDYHFYLVPELVRSRRPDLFVHFFVHVPWPQPDAWRVLPEEWRGAVLYGLLGSDVVAFHTRRYARNFLLGCEELLGLEVDHVGSAVVVDGREVAVRHYPISVDEATLVELTRDPESEQHERELASVRRDHLVLRVDRTDPSKNIVRGFRAYDRMLERHPELAGRVTFLALLQPSRQDVAEYVDYLAQIEHVVEEVNSRHGTPGWRPIDLRIGDDLTLAVAAYRSFDVLMVNPVFDGMNLVAKEALLVNERDGVLLLSENAGAHDELGATALTVNPFDIEQQADALFEALSMTPDERRRRHRSGVEVVRSNDVGKWFRHQLRDIGRLRRAR